ncbi:hypothetical protein SAMN02745163_04023 [Clostridium cavendishii DSM 21758]|uniref:DNA-binding ferritin-like protein (Dps family) n=1 Tax=Clostridium cavendishii DSM 21758 TaxID=1121302 RepID=A0A1M6TFP1_9CLOT|nr:hypothetical protein [Clostridium cavendishii]SHK55845.1 hypothetical protein SAMN02745163_04023 [Clostridium cavendishii DSM 21758]
MKTKELIKLNYKNSQKINKEYSELVTDIIAYVKCELTQDDGEEAVNDILDILLGAQERGEDLNIVVGDYKIFCDEVIKSYKDDNKLYFLKNVKEFIQIGLGMAFFFIALDVILKLKDVKIITLDNLEQTNYSFTLVPILNTIISVIFAYIIIKVIIRLDEKKQSRNILKSKSFYLMWIINIALIGIMVVIGLKFRNIILIAIPNYLVVLTVAIFVLVTYIIVFAMFSRKNKNI